MTKLTKGQKKLLEDELRYLHKMYFAKIFFLMAWILLTFMIAWIFAIAIAFNIYNTTKISKQISEKQFQLAGV